MSEHCCSCGKNFGLFRKRRSCDLCKKEFCGNCLFTVSLSWGGLNEPRYELVLEGDTIGYRQLPAFGMTKKYTLCAACRSRTDDKMKAFAAETRNRFASIVETDKGHIPGYTIVKRCGFIDYRPDTHMPLHGIRDAGQPGTLPSTTPPLLKKNLKALDYLKRRAVERGANALINVQVTSYDTVIPPPPPPTSRRTPLDFVPGYVEGRWREQAKPTKKSITTYRAEAVVIVKGKKALRHGKST